MMIGAECRACLMYPFRHKEALEHAKAAVLHCQKQLLASQSPSMATTDTDMTDTESDSESFVHSNRTLLGRKSTSTAATRALASAALTEKIVILGMVLHNL